MWYEDKKERLQQSIKSCNVLPPNWWDDFFWSSEWFFYVSLLVCMVTY